MAIIETIEKRRLIVTLGEAEAPAAWHWEAVRFLRHDDTNTDAAPPQGVTVPCTAEEAAAHISQAMVDLTTTMAAKDASIAALTTQRDEQAAAITEKDAAISAKDMALDTLTSQRDAAVNAATLVAQADAAWEVNVRPAVQAALS